MALSLHNCSCCSKPSAHFCFVCDHQLFEIHASNAYHACPTVSGLHIRSRELFERAN